MKIMQGDAYGNLVLTPPCILRVAGTLWAEKYENRKTSRSSMTGPSSTTGAPLKPISTVPSCATASISAYTTPREKPEGRGGTFRFLRGGAEIGFVVFRGEPSMMECLERHKITTLTP